jgi:cysteinyl-tRNA synthetase
LGVDEHTAAILNFNEDTLSVSGRSNAYWRLNGESHILANGTTTKLEELRTLLPSAPQRLTAESVATASTPVELAEAASGGGKEGLQALARLVQLASTGGQGFIDPTALVEGVLAARVTARAGGQYGLADELRDALTKAGIEVKDGPEGSTWSLLTD